MKNTLHELLAVRPALHPASQGAGAVNGVITDRRGYDEAMLSLQAGALGTNATLDAKIQHGNVSDGSDMADVSGAAITQMTQAGTDKSNKLALLRVRAEGLKRYIRVVSTVATAASLVGAQWIMLRNSGQVPEDNAAGAGVDQVKSVEA